MSSTCIAGPSSAAAAMCAAPEVHGVWIANPAEFARMGAQWDELCQRTKQENVFLTFAWIFTWWKHFGRGQLAVIAVRDDDGRLVAVAPFYVARSMAGMRTRRLGFLGDEYVGSDYLTILADPAFEAMAVREIVRVLFEHRGAWDYIELRDTVESPLCTALCGQLVARGMRAQQTARRVCYYIPLPATFEQYLGGISGSLRGNHRRRWRILQRDHQAECLAFSTPAEIQKYFPSLIALHRMRFEQRAAESAFLAPGVPEFHAEVVRELASQGLVRLYILQAAGQPIAALYGFAVGKTFQFYQCGMHTGWLRHGVGQVLIGNAIAHAIAAGHYTFDFLRGDESYKTQWSDRFHSNVTWIFSDQHPASATARWGLQAAESVRSVARRLKARLLREHSIPSES